MLDVTGNGALDVLIGLAFFYFVMSIVCSAVNEAIATAFNYRAKDLENGIRNLLGGDAQKDAFYADPRIKALFKPKGFLNRLPLLNNRLPSYISPRAFALAVLDTFAPPTETTEDLVSPPTEVLFSPPTEDLVGRAHAAVAKIQNPMVQTLLQDALIEAGIGADAVDPLRAALENAFNEAMDRVSGWYKRRVQLILFVIALIVVGSLNADSFRIGQTLWQNDAVRTSVVNLATKTSQGDKAVACGEKKGSTPSSSQKVADCVSSVKQLGLPLGWSKASSPSNWEGIAGKIGGLLVTAFAILLGAPFWFDTLNKLAQLRGTGQKPDTTGKGNSSKASNSGSQ